MQARDKFGRLAGASVPRADTRDFGWVLGPQPPPLRFIQNLVPVGAARAAAGGWGNVTPAVLPNQPARVTRPLCGSIANLAITEPSVVARANPIDPSGAGATSTTFQL
jgi:hypothetical protein